MKTIRVFGFTNILFGSIGLYFLLDSIFRFSHRALQTNDPHYLVEAYYATTAINFACLFILILGGAYLWRVERRGLRICNLLFSFEILYFIGTSWIGLSLSLSRNETAALIGDSVATTAATGNMGLNPQFLTMYPVIALIALNIAGSKLDKNNGWRRSES